jgi:O-antigen/teichoic acid export membrane protein
VIRWANVSVLVASIALAGVGAVAGLFFVRPSFEDSFRLGLLLVPLLALTLVRQGALQGLRHVELSFVPEQIIFPGLFLAMALAAWGWGVGHLSAVAAISFNLVAGAIAFACGVELLRRRLPREAKSAPRMPRSPEWLPSAVPFAVIGIITTAGTYLGVVILGSLANAHAVGLYQLASRLADIPAFALAAITASLAPLISRMQTLGRTGELQPVITRTARASLLFTAPVVALMVVFRHQLLELVGGGFGGSASVLSILVLGQLVNSAMGPVGVVLLMTGHERVAAVGFGVGLAANLALGLALVPVMGADGAAVARVAGLVLWNVGLAVATKRILGINATVFSRAVFTRRAASA